MERPGHEDVKFFTGIEVEHTPAFGHKTLFVVGLQSANGISTQLMANQDITHIFFGANQSFNPGESDDPSYEWIRWEEMIKRYVDTMYCSLDLDVRHVENLHDSCLCEKRKFIPMISVKLPYINQFNYNAVIKLDDTGFDKTNPGVWVHSLHDLQSRSTFTDWSKYTKDEVKK